jgi:calcineurin-like phosphoesterase family protein
MSDIVTSIPPPTWVISDTHFGHMQILTYCPWRRTWADGIVQHDEQIIAAWNSCVRRNDWVLHLGDVALGDRGRLYEIRQQLCGRIILVHGNHDRSIAKMKREGFDEVVSAVTFTINDRTYIGRHNPGAFSMREAQTSHLLLHGHSHGNPPDINIHPSIRAKLKDCSLDALMSKGPVAIASVIA